MARYNITERRGISIVQSIIHADMGWVFREQPIVDVGIDAHIETVQDGNPTGKLIAAQIKSGPSHFKENENTYTYYIDKTHHDYWLNHSLPVLLIGVLSRETVIWQKITTATVKKAGESYKTLIPKSQLLNTGAVEQLSKIAEGPDEVQQVRRLIADRPFINELHSGSSIYLEFDDWINKSLGRTEIVLVLENGKRFSWHYVFSGMTIFKLIEKLFPWAIISIDEDFYEAKCDYSEEVLDLIKRNHGKIYPYSDTMSEVEHYRVRLSINKLGRSLHLVYQYLERSI